MALLELQAAVTRLLSDAGWRERFFGSPADTLREAGLPPGVDETLLALDRGQVERYAASLLAKRAEAAQQFPWGMRAVLGESYDRWLVEYVRSVPPSAQPWEEARAFAEYVSRRAADGWVRDTATCAAARLSLLFEPEPHPPGWREPEAVPAASERLRLKPCCRVVRLAFDVCGWLSRPGGPGAGWEPEPDPGDYVLLEAAPWPAIRSRKLSAPEAACLRLLQESGAGGRTGVVPPPGVLACVLVGAGD